MTTPKQTTPPGWYDDGTGNQRFWDGERWTEQIAPTVTAPLGKSPSGKPHVLSWIAFALAVVGFVFACVPGALIVGWVLLPVAFVLSIVGFFLRGKKWPTITALILSVIGTIVGFAVFFTVVAVSFNDAFGSTDVSVSQPEKSDDTSEASDTSSAGEVGTREKPAAIGSTISGKDWQVVINSVTFDANEAVLAANQFNEAPPAGYSYAVVNATMTYTGKDSGFAMMVGISYVTREGKVINRGDNMAVAPEPAIGMDELYEGASVTGNTVLAVPDTKDGLLRVTPGMFGDDVFVSVK